MQQSLHVNIILAPEQIPQKYAYGLLVMQIDALMTMLPCAVDAVTTG